VTKIETAPRAPSQRKALPDEIEADDEMSIEKAIQDLSALDKHDAERLSDQIRDLIIDEVLQRDPNMPNHSYAVWVLVLAGVRQQIAQLIHDVIHDHIDRSDVLDELRDHDLLDVECEQ
jgi:hypothetical protein